MITRRRMLDETGAGLESPGGDLQQLLQMLQADPQASEAYAQSQKPSQAVMEMLMRKRLAPPMPMETA